MTRSVVLALAILTLAPAGAARASLVDAFHGTIDLMAVQSETDGEESDFLRQEYNANFRHAPTANLDFRAGARYYDFDQEVEAVLSGYRREFQPSGEVRWSSPWFVLGVGYLRREVRTQVAETDFITESGQVSLQTRDRRYPLLTLRYDEQHSWETDSAGDEDVRSRRFLASADHSRGNHFYGYSFQHTRNDNIISGVEAKTLRHLLRWNGVGFVDEARRLRLSGNASFNYADRRSGAAADGGTLEILNAVTGLAGIDETPDLGELDPVSGLADGDRDNPPAPLISIGGNDVDRNVGLDLSRPEPVVGLYIYTDRPSGGQVRWRVYGSRDNDSWTLVSSVPDVRFNGTVNRYELLFPAAGEYRYIKAVNSGVNDVVGVNVTEVEALRIRAVGSGNKLVSAISVFGGRADYRLRDDLRTSLDLALQHDRAPGEDDSHRIDYAWRLLYDATENLSHQVRWEESRQQYSGSRQDLREATAAYAAVYERLPALRGSAALSERLTYADGERLQETFSSLGEISGSPLPTLDLSVGMNWGRTRGYGAAPDRETWNARFGFDAELRPNLALFVNQNHQETRTRGTDELRVRRLYDAGVDWRLTRNIFARVSVVYAVEESRNVTEDVLVTWNLTDSLRLTAQHYGVRRDEILTTDRNNVSANLDLGAKSSLYLRLSEVDLSGGGGQRTLAFQQGIRLGF